MMDCITTKIVEASTELFIRNGIKCITMDDVAQNLGMSKRTIYEHFENKRALLSACIDYNYDTQAENEAQLVAHAKNIVEELYYILKPVGNDNTAKAKFSLELKRYFPDLFKELYINRHQHISSRIRARLQRGVDQHIIQETTDLNISVYVIFTTINSFLTHPEDIRDLPFSSEDLFRYAFISFFRGIATPKGVAMIDEMIDNINKNK
ncbi:MAG: TetR/AcrR family transcriptional regulator [Mucinivorans sp.]